MPKLSLAKIKDNKASIELAAVKCFVGKGYNGVSIRDIAKKAQVSVGNLYNYYPDKLSLFTAVLKKVSEDYLRYAETTFETYIQIGHFPNDIDLIAEGITSLVEKNGDYIKLMYVDVIEFNGAHLHDVFKSLHNRVGAVIGKKMQRLGMLGKDKTVSPSVAFMSVYLLFYQYYVYTDLFKVKHLYGKLSKKEVTKQLVNMFLKGIAIKE
jgi:AcrR family transcriptional regulator